MNTTFIILTLLTYTVADTVPDSLGTNKIVIESNEASCLITFFLSTNSPLHGLRENLPPSIQVRIPQYTGNLPSEVNNVKLIPYPTNFSGLRLKITVESILSTQMVVWVGWHGTNNFFGEKRSGKNVDIVGEQMRCYFVHRNGDWGFEKSTERRGTMRVCLQRQRIEPPPCDEHGNVLGERCDKTISEEQALDIAEATFRYMFAHYNSMRSRTGGPYFLRLLGRDPSREFITRFEDQQVPVMPGSWFQQGKGIKLLVERIIRESEAVVEVYGGYYELGLSSSRETYILELKNGKWSVVRVVLHWIS